MRTGLRKTGKESTMNTIRVPKKHTPSFKQEGDTRWTLKHIIGEQNIFSITDEVSVVCKGSYEASEIQSTRVNFRECTGGAATLKSVESNGTAMTRERDHGCRKASHAVLRGKSRSKLM